MGTWSLRNEANITLLHSAKGLQLPGKGPFHGAPQGGGSAHVPGLLCWLRTVDKFLGSSQSHNIFFLVASAVLSSWALRLDLVFLEMAKSNLKLCVVNKGNEQFVRKQLKVLKRAATQLVGLNMWERSSRELKSTGTFRLRAAWGITGHFGTVPAVEMSHGFRDKATYYLTCDR